MILLQNVFTIIPCPQAEQSLLRRLMSTQRMEIQAYEIERYLLALLYHKQAEGAKRSDIGRDKIYFYINAQKGVVPKSRLC